jgi:hypothetical protein
LVVKLEISWGVQEIEISSLKGRVKKGAEAQIMKMKGIPGTMCKKVGIGDKGGTRDPVRMVPGKDKPLKAGLAIPGWSP